LFLAKTGQALPSAGLQALCGCLSFIVERNSASKKELAFFVCYVADKKNRVYLPPLFRAVL
jgi:hypothetical protein